MSVQPEPVKGVVPMVASVVQPVQQIMVQVPAGMAPGMQMQVQTPSGLMMVQLSYMVVTLGSLGVHLVPLSYMVVTSGTTRGSCWCCFLI